MPRAIKKQMFTFRPKPKSRKHGHGLNFVNFSPVPFPLSRGESNPSGFKKANSAKYCGKIYIHTRGMHINFILVFHPNFLFLNSQTLYAEKLLSFGCVRAKQGWRLAKTTMPKGSNLASIGPKEFNSPRLNH